MANTELHTRIPVTESFDAGYLEYNGILPLEVTGEKLRVAVTGDPAVEVLDGLEISYGLQLDLVPVSPEELLSGINRAFSTADSVVELLKDLDGVEGNGIDLDDSPLADVRDLANQPPVIRYVNLLIRDAYSSRASDIHLESTRDGLRARFRVDGVLMDVSHPPRGLESAVVSRIKLLAEIDIAERRRPQDGRIRVRLDERELDLRVATVPTLYGESVVMRLLDRGGRPVALQDLGMDSKLLEEFQHLASRAHGIVLVTGPTGCGKTTTLYAAMSLHTATAEKIITVEDPVEYHLNGITQVPVRTKAGMTFESALRSILRQDPDVLMVGEMRDPDTAQIAVQAAMTGHLVFSTVHTNDAISAIARLVDLSVEPYMIAAALEGILAQRLVRKVCPDCRSSYKPDSQMVALLAGRPVAEATFERGRGCAACRDTGYLGRIGVFGLVTVTEELKRGILKTADATSLREIAQDSGATNMLADGWRKVQAGITTVEEVLRVTQS